MPINGDRYTTHLLRLRFVNISFAQLSLKYVRAAIKASL